MSGYFGVKGVEGGFEVLGKLLEGLCGVSNGGICHLIIPSFSIEDSSSTAHLIQGDHDLGSISVEGQVQDEVGFHGLDPLGDIIIFARKISWEDSIQF